MPRGDVVGALEIQPCDFCRAPLVPGYAKVLVVDAMEVCAPESLSMLLQEAREGSEKALAALQGSAFAECVTSETVSICTLCFGHGRIQQALDEKAKRVGAGKSRDD